MVLIQPVSILVTWKKVLKLRLCQMVPYHSPLLHQRNTTSGFYSETEETWNTKSLRDTKLCWSPKAPISCLLLYTIKDICPAHGYQSLHVSSWEGLSFRDSPEFSRVVALLSPMPFVDFLALAASFDKWTNPLALTHNCRFLFIRAEPIKRKT